MLLYEYINPTNLNYIMNINVKCKLFSGHINTFIFMT